MAALPPLGFGTFQLTGDDCRRAVRTALETGYRHVDTAQYYGNEREVGDALAAADVDRDDVVVATKLWHDSLDRESVLSGVAASRDRLGVDTVDLVYVHWPANTYDPAETLGALSACHEDGLLGAVGLSNFTPALAEEALAHCDAPVTAVQVECHPLLPQDELRAFCDARGLDVAAYHPLVHGRAFGVPEVRAVADEHGVSEAQVLLAWARAKGVTPIPKATGDEHVRDNYASLGLDLDSEAVARIDGIDDRLRLGDPEFAPDW
ncbi:aldo/keto reductase [Halobacterium yunchengense]|uniref:aldo/keto reductase n=1 Tax=Halobacterium yunchengense TaxID=3108497 RepID=UPI0030090DF2